MSDMQATTRHAHPCSSSVAALGAARQEVGAEALRLEARVRLHACMHWTHFMSSCDSAIFRPATSAELM